MGSLIRFCNSYLPLVPSLHRCKWDRKEWVDADANLGHNLENEGHRSRSQTEDTRTHTDSYWNTNQNLVSHVWFEHVLARFYLSSDGFSGSIVLLERYDCTAVTRSISICWHQASLRTCSLRRMSLIRVKRSFGMLSVQQVLYSVFESLKE